MEKNNEVRQDEIRKRTKSNEENNKVDRARKKRDKDNDNDRHQHSVNNQERGKQSGQEGRNSLIGSFG